MRRRRVEHEWEKDTVAVTVEPRAGALASPGGARRHGRSRTASIPVSVWVPSVLVAAGMCLPVVYLVIRAASAGPDLWDIVVRPRTADLLIRTAGLAIAVTAAATAIAVPLAWLVTRTDLPLRRLWTILTVLPLAVPTYVGGFAFIAAIGPRGLLQGALSHLFNVQRLPEIYGFPGAWLVLTLFSYPYIVLSVRASLLQMDPSLEEASRSLGRGTWETFRRVTLPQMQPAVAAGGLLVALYTLSDFGAVSLLQYESFTWAIYLQYRASFDRTLAAALALLLVALTALVTILEARLRGRARYHRVGVGAARPASPIRLGWWRWPALTFCGLIVLLGVGIPLLVLIYWLRVDLANPLRLAQVMPPAASTVYASALAAVATVAAALPIAILTARYPGRLSALVERIAYSGFALPGIVIALALIFFGARFATPLYQTLFLLIIAYAARFLPQAVGAARATLLHISPSVEEVARTLGRSHTGVLLTVTIPLLRPGIVAGAALVFLTTVKELPATLLLAPIGFQTLATRLWMATNEGMFAEAAAPALLLVAVSMGAMATMTLTGRRVDA